MVLIHFHMPVCLGAIANFQDFARDTIIILESFRFQVHTAFWLNLCFSSTDLALNHVMKFFPLLLSLSHFPNVFFFSATLQTYLFCQEV